ncbi:hypothetical protein ACHAPV_008425, partial [Trichoderma viride]
EGEKNNPDLSRHDILKRPQQKNPPEGTQYDDDRERANTLMALYDIRSKLKQQALQYTELSMKKAEEMRQNRYSFPKVSLERRAGTEEVDFEKQLSPDDAAETQLLQKQQLISSSWSPEDDQLLVIAHMLGFTWAEIEEDYLQSKTANACIERHERLMMRRRANGWDSNKMETLAKEYVSMHEEIWSGLAARVGENWRVIEEKCMSSDPETSQSTTHEAGTIPGNHPIKPTPIAGRVSRAKKGVPHTCEVCRPPKDCGVELYGDFMVDKASDLDGLGLSLHMPAENTSTVSSSDSEESVQTRTNPRHMISRSSSTRTALSTTSTDASSIDIVESKFLALCINTGSIYKTLAELDMSRINSDGEAFSQMKKAYIQYRGVRSRLRFLIKPVTVEFVRFTLWNLRRGYVSISDRPSSMPPNTRIDYDFVPPPMPPEVFVHYLEHGDGDLSPNRYTWLPRLPKRLNNKVMDCGEATEGWGIHVVEGPNREVVFWVLMITISASVLASVLWTTLKGDIQGGTGLGALIIALPPAIMAAFLFRLGAT